jgi:hypothetical protein
MRTQRRIYHCISLCLITLSLHAQQTADSVDKRWVFSGYAESFITLSDRGTKTGKISEFQYNHNRYGTPKLNHGYVDMEYNGNKMRMKTALHTGTYVKDNYGGEPSSLRPILNASLGILISKPKNIWIDAGIFPSYIGFESTHSFDNYTLSRSLLAENSPYYLSGIHMNYPLSSDQELNFFLLTGWQKILPVKGNSLPSLGIQWIRKFDSDNKLNWSFFAGSDYPNDQRKIRYFNNLFWQRKRGSWAYTIGLDVGAEQKRKNDIQYNFWWSPVLITSYSINEKLKVTTRIEHYNDRNSVIVKTGNGNELIVSGYSMNIDYQPNTNLLFRAEWRKLWASKEVFYLEKALTKHTSYITLSASYRFRKPF